MSDCQMRMEQAGSSSAINRKVFLGQVNYLEVRVYPCGIFWNIETYPELLPGWYSEKQSMVNISALNVSLKHRHFVLLWVISDTPCFLFTRNTDQPPSTLSGWGNVNCSCRATSPLHPGYIPWHYHHHHQPQHSPKPPPSPFTITISIIQRHLSTLDTSSLSPLILQFKNIQGNKSSSNQHKKGRSRFLASHPPEKKRRIQTNNVVSCDRWTECNNGVLLHSGASTSENSETSEINV